MTKNELCERAKRRLNAGAGEPHIWPESEMSSRVCVGTAASLEEDSVGVCACALLLSILGSCVTCDMFGAHLL